jgi:cell shape-determining protein MreC
MSDNKKKVEGHPGIYKDIKTGVIVNRGQTDRERYRTAKRQARQTFEQGCEIEELKRDLEELKDVKEELSELKDLLRELLSKQTT